MRHSILSIVCLLGFISCDNFLNEFAEEGSEETVEGTLESNNQFKAFSELIASSYAHSPDGTWWGYNMKKIVRYKDRVFSYYIDNKSPDVNGSRFSLISKLGDAEWQNGAKLPTSRPGNLLMDSQGVLHAFVYEAHDYANNDSVGDLIHYWFPKAADGNINDFLSEILVDYDGSHGEQVNIRVGAAISDADEIVIAYGMTKNITTPLSSLDDGHTMHVLRKSVDGDWQQELAGKNLGHDFYYPFVAVSSGKVALLPVQDDFIPDSSASYPNEYQMVPYFSDKGGVWQHEILEDRRNHPYAQERLQIIEQSELFIDSEGKSHLIYKERLGELSSVFSQIVYLEGGLGDWSRVELANEERNLNWVRIFEMGGKLRFVGFTYDQLMIANDINGPWQGITLEHSIPGAYLYIANQTSGPSSEEYLDILLVSGSSNSYPNGPAAYVRLPKELFLKL